MDKTLAKRIHAEMNAALKEVADHYGLKPIKTRLKYGDHSITLNVDWQTPGGKSKEELQYERYQRVLGLPKLGTKFSILGRDCTTAGLLVGGPYKTLLYRQVGDGKLFKLNVNKAQQHVPALKV